MGKTEKSNSKQPYVMVMQFNPRVKGLKKPYTEVLEHFEDEFNLQNVIWYDTYHWIQQTHKYRRYFDQISLTIGTLNLDACLGLFYRRNTLQLQL